MGQPYLPRPGQSTRFAGLSEQQSCNTDRRGSRHRGGVPQIADMGALGPSPRLGATARQRSPGELRADLEELRADVVAAGGELLESWGPRVRREEYLASARNLAHYVALRRHELRELQLELMPWGLSSLGRCEARVWRPSTP